MAGAEKIDPSVLEDLIAQKQARSIPSQDVIAGLDEQKRLREGDYPIDTLPGIGQGAVGVAENLGQMVSGFFSAIPGAAAGVGAAIGARDPAAYAEAFQEQADKTTYSPRTRKGKKIQGAIENAYNKYIHEGWGEYIGEQVDKGYITPAEGAFYRTSADALIMGIPMKVLGRKGKTAEREVDIDAPPPIEGRVEPTIGEVVTEAPRVGEPKAPRQGETIEGEFSVLDAESVPLRLAVREAAAKGVDVAEIKKAAGDAEVIDLAARRIKALPAPEPKAQPGALSEASRQSKKEKINDIPNAELESLKEFMAEAAEAANAFERGSSNLFEGLRREALTQSDAHIEVLRRALDDVGVNPDRYFDRTPYSVNRRTFSADEIDAAIEGDFRPNIFRNKQAGAVDLGVLAEGIKIALRPARMTAKGAYDVTKALGRQVAFKQISDIRDIPSPTAKMLADRIMPKQDSTIPLEAGFHERVSVKQGEYGTRIDNILEPLRRHVANANSMKSARLVALPKKKNDALFRGLDTGKVAESLVPQTKAIRAILDEMLKYQQEAGVNIERRSNYLPHMWDHKKIARLEYGRPNGGAFTKFLMEKGFSREAAAQTISKIIHEEGFLEFAQDTGGRLQKGQDFSEWGRAFRVGGSETKPAHTRARKIEASFDDAKNFLVTDLEAVLTNYVRKAVEKAEYTRLAGPGEVKLNQTVRQIVEEAALVSSEAPHKIAQNVYDMFDALQHRFHQIESPAVKGLVKFVNGWEVMAHLGLVSLAQLPESLMPAIKYRVATTTKGGVPIPLKSYAKGMMSAVQDAASSASTVLTGKRIIPKSEIKKHLERIGISNVSALESSIARMTNTSGVLTSRFIRTVLMEAVTDLQRGVALDTIQSVVRQNARYLAKGKKGKKTRMYEKELIELGLKPQEVIEWHKAGMPKDHPIQAKLDVAVVRGVNNTIMMPKAANSPRLYNDPRFQPVLLFTRFMTVFGNTFIKKVLKDIVHKDVTTPRKLAAMSAMAASVAVAYYTQFVREDITGYQVRKEDDPMRVVDAVDRAGWTAMFTRLYPLLMSEYRYQLGPSYVTNLLGGPIGTDVAKLIEAAKGTNKQKARWMANMTPVANITPETKKELEAFYLELLEEMD